MFFFFFFFFFFLGWYTVNVMRWHTSAAAVLKEEYAPYLQDIMPPVMRLMTRELQLTPIEGDLSDLPEQETYVVIGSVRFRVDTKVWFLW